MAVTFRSAGVSPGVTTTTCVIVKPVGLTAGDLMIAQCTTGDANEDYTPPANWTSIRVDEAQFTNPKSTLFWKIADAADAAAANFTFSLDGLNRDNLGAITAWYGHDPITPINAHNGQGNAASTTVTAPTITPSVADCVICMICAIYRHNTQSAYAIANDNPGSWNERYDVLYDFKLAVAMGSASRPETSATGNGTATTSGSDKNVGQLVAIAPAVAVLPAGGSPLAQMIQAGLV